jgi:erythromycin esterase
MYLNFNIKLLFFAILVSSCCGNNPKSVVPWNNDLTVEQNIAKNAVGFQTNDEFPFLDKIAKTRQVIILGEAAHFELTTSEIKVKMIDYLKNKGYKALALERTPFLSAYVFSNPEYAEITKEWKTENLIPYFWLKQETFKPLFDKINKREIELWGMDIDLGFYDISSAQAILKRYTNRELLDVDWERLTDLYLRKFVVYDHEPLPFKEQHELMSMINELSNQTQYAIYRNENATDLKALIQWFRILNAAYSYIDRDISSNKEVDYVYLNRTRDSQMAENILWITENFPSKKCTVWCANYHGAKDISQIQFCTDTLLYSSYSVPTMGKGVYNKLGHRLYSLAITSLDPKYWEKGILEQEMANAIENKPFAYIDYEPLRFADGYRNKEFDCAVIPMKKENGKWLYVFDGLYYIRDQKI